MPIVRKLVNLGNSKGLILPQPVLEMLGWDLDTELELHVVEGRKLVLTPAETRPPSIIEERPRKRRG